MADKVIKFRGEFDASQILSSLKQIRSQMSQAGAKDSLFTGVDKDIASAEKAMHELIAQAQKGFKNSNEVDQFSKKFEKLDLMFTKIGSELGELNLAENFSQTSPELEKIKKKLADIAKENESLKTAALDVTDKTKTTAIATEEYRKEIKKAIEAEKDLGKAVEDVYNKQAQTNYGRLSSKFQGLSSDAFSKAQSDIAGFDVNKLNFSKDVSTDFLDKYRQAMVEIITEGKNVKEVLDNLGKELGEEDQAYATSGEFVKDYAENLRTIALAVGKDAGINSGTIGKYVKDATSMGGYSTSGQFFATPDIQPVIAYGNQIQQNTSLLQQQETENSRLAAAAQSAAAQINAGLQTERSNQERVTEAQRENINATRDQVTTQEQLNSTFDRMSTAVTQLFSIGTAWSTVRRVVQETFQDVQKLDKAFASIAMVTSYSVEEMWGSYDQYAEMANRLGQSTESVIQSSALFYQQGRPPFLYLRLQFRKLFTKFNISKIYAL